MRRFLTWIHRWVGLAIAAPLAVVGLTGSILAFGPDIDALLNPELFSRVQAARPLDLDRLVARIERQLPDARIIFLAPPRGQSSVMMRVEPRSEKRPIGFDQLFAEPATGQLLGVRTWDGCGLSRAQIIPCTHRIHYSLLIPGMAGILFVGIVGLIWFVQQVIGLPITFPSGRRRLKRWMAAWRVDRRSASTSFGVHRLVGLWTWLALTVVAITGAGISLEHVLFRPLVSAFSPLTPGIGDSGRAADGEGEILSYERARWHAVSVAKATEGGSAALVTGISHHASAGYYSVAMEFNPQSSGFGPSWYHIDDRDGRMLAAETWGGGSVGDALMRARLPLHGGRALGLPGRAIISLSGLVVAILSVTGVMIWMKRSRGKRVQARRTADRRSPVPVDG